MQLSNIKQVKKKQTNSVIKQQKKEKKERKIIYRRGNYIKVVVSESKVHYFAFSYLLEINNK